MKTNRLIIIILMIGLFSACHHNDFGNDPEDWNNEEEMQDAGLLLSTLIDAGIQNPADNQAADASLQNILVSGQELTPGFNPSVYFYTVSIPLTETSAAVTIIPADNSILVRLNGYAVLPGLTYLVPLASSSQTIVIETNAQEVSKTYTILVNRI